MTGGQGQEATILLSQPVLLVAVGLTCAHFSSRQAVVGRKLPCPPVFCFQASPALAIDDLTALEKCTTKGAPHLTSSLGTRSSPFGPRGPTHPGGTKMV